MSMGFKKKISKLTKIREKLTKFSPYFSAYFLY